jgi:A/G-specific adenine glycosylase
VDPDRPGDFNQALMDLGATVCTPTSPACGACPVRAHCRAAAEEQAAAAIAGSQLRRALLHAETAPSERGVGPPPCSLCPPSSLVPPTLEALQQGLPVTRYPPKPPKPHKALRAETHIVAVAYCDAEGVGERRYAMRQRPPQGLLAGLWECPMVPHSPDPPADADVGDDATTPDADGDQVLVAAARPRVDALLCALGIVASPAAIVRRRWVGRLSHIFTHLRHEYLIEAVQVPALALAHASTAVAAAAAAEAVAGTGGVRWISAAAIGTDAVATGMRKAIALAAKTEQPKRARPQSPLAGSAAKQVRPSPHQPTLTAFLKRGKGSVQSEP